MEHNVWKMQLLVFRIDITSGIECAYENGKNSWQSYWKKSSISAFLCELDEYVWKGWFGGSYLHAIRLCKETCETAAESIVPLYYCVTLLTAGRYASCIGKRIQINSSYKTYHFTIERAVWNYSLTCVLWCIRLCVTVGWTVKEGINFEKWDFSVNWTVFLQKISKNKIWITYCGYFNRWYVGVVIII
jgi:hypothetical protein